MENQTQNRRIKCKTKWELVVIGPNPALVPVIQGNAGDAFPWALFSEASESLGRAKQPPVHQHLDTIHLSD